MKWLIIVRFNKCYNDKIKEDVVYCKYKDFKGNKRKKKPTQNFGQKIQKTLPQIFKCKAVNNEFVDQIRTAQVQLKWLALMNAHIYISLYVVELLRFVRMKSYVWR